MTSHLPRVLTLLVALAAVALPACRTAPDATKEVASDGAPAAKDEAGGRRLGGAERKRPFVRLEYDPYHADGTGSIEGQAFLKTRGGDVKFGAGNLVHLKPVTSYSQEWFEREIMRGESLAAPDPRADHYHWTTRADGFGGFRFDGLPPGEYYAACSIHWEFPDGQGGTRRAGGWAWARVRVEDAEESRAILTR